MCAVQPCHAHRAAGGVHFHVGHHRGVAGGLVDAAGHAAPAPQRGVCSGGRAGRALHAPARGLRHALQAARQPRVVDVGQPERHRVHADVACTGVDGRLDGQHVGAGAEPAPRAGVHGQAHGVELGAPHGRLVRQGRAAGHAGIADEVGQALQPRRQRSAGEQDVAAGKGVPPVLQPAVLQPGTDAVARRRAVEAQLQLLRARPLHLHRPARGGGEQRCFQLDGAQRLAAERTTDPQAVHVHALQRQAEPAGDHVALVEDVLRTHPQHQATARRGLGHGAARLDGGMRGQRHVDAQVHVPGRVLRHVVCMHRVRQAARALQPRIDVDGRGDVGARGAVDRPRHRERALHGVQRRGRARHDADAGRLPQLQPRVMHQLHETRHRARRGLLQTQRPARQLGRRRRAQHAAEALPGAAHVGHEQWLPGDERQPLLQGRRALRHAGLQRTQRRQRPLPRLHAVLRGARRHRLAQRGTGLGQRHGEVAHRLAAHGGPHAADGLRVVQLHVEQRGRDRELGAGDLRQRGGDVLAHLGPRHDQAVAPAVEADPARGVVEVRGRAPGHHGQRAAGREADAQHQRRGLQEAPAAGRHDEAPVARRTAARTRWWVPQRHRWPASAASMSVSPGCGRRRSRATVLRICPLWQ